MERRKMFVATILVLIILLQSFLPLIQVSALSGYDVAISTNNKLYQALKEQLIKSGINAYYDEANCRILTSNEEISNITELDLSNYGIDDLTGLGVFTNVTNLNLTSNKLTSESNLEELDKLPLEKLNLSSNEIESVDSMMSFDNIKYADITNQQIEKRDVIQLDISENSEQQTTTTIELPSILLKDGGEMQPEWLEDLTTSGCYAHVNWANFNPKDTTCELEVAARSESSYNPYRGLLTIEISIDDPESKLYNTNIKLYYVITNSEETGICFNDDNLYKAIKKQLTRGQYENEELASYGFSSNSVTLYTAAYDQAKILVISNDVLINEITSLILNDKKIEDLTGIEKFIGLESTLDVSYNYIDSLERILELEANKQAAETKLRENYTVALNVVKTNVSTLASLKKELEDIEKQIEDINSQIAQLDSTASDYDKKVNDLLNKLNDEDEGLLIKKSDVTKELSTYRKLVNEGLTKLYSIYKDEYKLTTLLPLSVYDLSADDISDLSLESVKSLSEEIMTKVSTLESNNGLLSHEKEIIIKAFSIPVTKMVEEQDADGNVTEKEVEIEQPITEYFETIRKRTDYNTISDYKTFIKGFKYIDLVTTAMNYCLIERMNNVNDAEDDTYCFFMEGLEELESFYTENAMDTTMLTKLIKTLNGETIYIPASEQTIITALIDIYNQLEDDCQGDYQYSEEIEEQLAVKLSNVTNDELVKFIVLPRIKYLNIEDNKLESLSGIEELKNLLGLYAFKNILGSIDDVNWSEMTSLKELDLGYNQLSNVKPLEVLTGLTSLKLSRNLLSGNFDFYLAGMKDLKTVDFSYNQYSNIAYLVTQYRFIAKGQGYDNVGEFLANSYYAPDISFQYQSLNIKATILKEGSTTRMNLPRIFEQCEELDNLRTSFGETSMLGTVLADGSEVILTTPSEGTYSAYVVIEGRNGNSYSTDGIGYGTSCSIVYTVVEVETPELDIPEEPGEIETPENPTDPTTPENPGETETPVEDVEYGYVVRDELVFVNTPEITIETFKNNLVSGEEYTVTVLNENREVVSDATILKTGYVVSVDKNGENIDNVEVVVKGDVNGDGEVDALDTGIVRQVINDTKELVGVYALAADVNSDGEIDSSDSLQILKYRAAKINMFVD